MFKVYKYSVSGGSNDVLSPLGPSPHYQAVYDRQIMERLNMDFIWQNIKKKERSLRSEA